MSFENSGQMRTMLLSIMTALLGVYILVFTIGYTLEFRAQIHLVVVLPVCRTLLLLSACLFLFDRRRDLARSFDPFALCVAAILVFGAASGLLEHNDRLVFLRQGFQYVFLLVFYLVGGVIAGQAGLWTMMRVGSVLILIGYGVATVIYAATPGLHSGSYSFAPNLALLPAAFGVSSGAWAYSAIATAIVVIGNKRAVYLGLCVLFAAALALWLERRRGGRPLWQRFIVTAAAAPAIAAALGFAISALTSTMHLSPITSAVVDRFSVEPTFNGVGHATGPAAGQSATAAPVLLPDAEARVDHVVRFTSGRNVEAASVWNILKTSSRAMLAGHGLGSTFMMRYLSPNDYAVVEFERDQADLAPVHIALTSGMPLALIFTLLLAGMLVVAFVRLDRADGVNQAVALFAIASGIDTLLGFHPTDPVVWLALGMLARQLLPDFSLSSLTARFASHG